MIDLTEEQHSSDESNKDEITVTETKEFVCPTYPDFLPLSDLSVTHKVESENSTPMYKISDSICEFICPDNHRFDWGTGRGGGGGGGGGTSDILHYVVE